MTFLRLRYKFAEAAEVLGVSLRTIEDLVSDRRIVCHQDNPGGTRFISLEALTNYIREREEEPVFGRLANKRRAG